MKFSKIKKKINKFVHLSIYPCESGMAWMWKSEDNMSVPGIEHRSLTFAFTC